MAVEISRSPAANRAARDRVFAGSGRRFAPALFAAALILVGSSPSSAEVRNWTDVSGTYKIEALISQVGRAQPDWWDSVRLNYPQTLDLSWPEKPPGKWNAQRNVGQYLWDVINPNPGKWREGARLLRVRLPFGNADRSV